MDSLVKWLVEIELKAAELYRRAAVLMADDTGFAKFAASLASDETWHAEQLAKAAAHTRFAGGKKGAIAADAAVMGEIEKKLAAIEEAVAALPASKDAFFEAIVEAELSEWNDLFLYAVNTLKEGNSEMQRLASHVTSHRLTIERFAETNGLAPAALARLKHLPGVWKRNILIVEDEPSVSDILSIILQKLGKMTVAGNGREALDRMKENYYDLIFSDIDMPVLNGLDFYLEAASLDPEVGRRMVFFSGQANEEAKVFFRKHDLKYLAKPSGVMEIREAAEEVLKRSATRSPAASSRH